MNQGNDEKKLHNSGAASNGMPESGNRSSANLSSGNRAGNSNGRDLQAPAQYQVQTRGKTSKPGAGKDKSESKINLLFKKMKSKYTNRTAKGKSKAGNAKNGAKPDGSIEWKAEVGNAAGIAGRATLHALSYVANVFLTILLIGLITGAIVGTAFAVYVKQYIDPSVDDVVMMVSKQQDTTTKIFCMEYTDRENRIGEAVELENQRQYGTENQMYASYSEFPENLVDAFVSIEDHRFFEHSGVDWRRTIGATFYYFTGQDTYGGSTITQQLIKNLTGDDDVTIQRKVQEILRALNLEKKLDKTQILEMYMNIVYLSQGSYGVSAAAWTYFGKEVSDLNLVECAAIASITQNPIKWDPIRHPDNNKERRQTVLYRMHELGKISDEEYEEAYDTDLVLNVQSDAVTATGQTVNSWYTDAAIDEALELLQEKYSCTREAASKMLYTGGLSIITAMDKNVQSTLEKYYLDANNFTTVDSSFIQPESSCVIIDPSTGDVLGLVGGRGEKKGNRILNYATQTKRPPGSSIKPLSVYAPALENGLINYASVIDDSPVNFGETTDENGNTVLSRPDGYPSNLPNVYNGLTTIHDGIRRSVNTVAYKTLQKLGLDTSFNFATKELEMTSLVERQELTGGVIVSDKDYAPLALGQLSYGATVLEMTAAYSIFANDGVYNSPRIVLQILDSEGNIVVDNQQNSRVVLSEQNAYIMERMLSEVVESGTASKLTLDDYVDVAGKTGTTTSDYDRWFVGYTPYYICGVWFGYSMPKSLGSFSATMSPSLLIWDGVMKELHQPYIEAADNGTEPLKKFEDENGVVMATYCKDSGKLITDACMADPRGNRAETGYFAVDDVPTESCDCHIMVKYDTSTGAIATSDCPRESIKNVGLIQVERTFPTQVCITDAQYVYRQVSPTINLMPVNEERPYYYYAFDGMFAGTSGWGTQFNHLCTEHYKGGIVNEYASDKTADTP